ncbi:MAG: hypothetical protein ACOYON_10865 [Fimbriimonas sp.]
MSSVSKKSAPSGPKPWIPLLLLILTAAVAWGLPLYQGSKPVSVSFDGGK